MKIHARSLHCLFFFIFSGLVGIWTAEAFVIFEGDRTYLEDRTGERWDITQARSIGFDPRYFEFGIGRNAFDTLDEDDWSRDNHAGIGPDRIIGVAGEDESHAYSVSKLARHETANTRLNSEPILAAY